MKVFHESGITTQLIRTFLAVVEERSIAKAAARLREDPSTLSHRIKRLQEIWGERLFVRAGRGITLTSFGEDILPDLRAALEKIDAISVRRNFLPALIDNVFTIATTDIERSIFLLDCLHDIWAEAPGAKVRFVWESYADFQALRYTDLDFILSPIVGSQQGDMVQRILFSDRAVCYYDPSMREAPDTFEDYLAADHVCVLFAQTDVSLTEVALHNLGKTRHIKLTISTVSELPKLILGTDLIVTMPSRLHESVLKDLSYCELPFTYEPMQFRLFWHERTHNSPRHRWVRQKIIDTAARL